MALLILYLSLALLVSFLCSILEAVLLSITPSYVASLEAANNPLGKTLQRMKDDIDKPLAAILSFNTIAHTVGAAGVGAQAAKIYGDTYLGVVSAVLTLLILIFSEIIPKTLGALYWRSLSGFTAKTLKILIILMYPLVLLSKGITKVLAGDKKHQVISRDEVSAMTHIGEKEGIFKKNESLMLRNMIRLRDVRAKDVMTPRTVVIMASEELTVKDWFEKQNLQVFSRIPVFRSNRDDITGYVHKNDILTSLVEGNDQVKLKDIKRNLTSVSEEEVLPLLLDDLLQTQEHLAMVTDVYGGTSGLVTLEDIMETVLGMEIMDEYDSHADMQKYAHDQRQKRSERNAVRKPSTDA